MNLKKIILGSMISLVMISCGSKDADNSGAAAPEYPVMAVKKQTAILENVYPVTLKGQEDVEIRPRIDGWIENIYVDEGSVVRAGQRLFDINSPQAQQAYRTAKASVNSAQAQVNTAQLNVDRIRPLAEKGIVSDVQLDTYVNALETANANFAQAQASMVNAEATLSWTQVTSPVNGIVGTLPFRKGSLVNSANALTTVANTSKIYAYFSMNEKEFIVLLNRTEGNTQAEKIKNLPLVDLVLANGTKYPEKGKIETISGSTMGMTGTFNFRAEFPNEGAELRSGFSGRLHLPHEVADVFVIPQKATFHQQDRVVVYKVKDNTINQYLIATENMPDGQHYAVTEGLEEGEEIVIDNLATLSNGMKITPKKQ